MPDIRYCTINPNGGGLSVTMTADNGLRAGGRFGLYDTSQHLQEDWSVATGDDGEGEYQIKAGVGTLDGFEMVWRTRVCAFVPGVDSGRVDLTVTQDGVSCPLTSSTEWDLTDVPECSAGQAQQKIFSLIFKTASGEEPV